MMFQVSKLWGAHLETSNKLHLLQKSKQNYTEAKQNEKLVDFTDSL